jgi:hypothetical protein
MKLIARTLAIVMLTLLVVGATIAIVGTSGTASAAPGRAEVRQPPEGFAGDANSAQRPDHGEGGASLFGIAEVGMDLGIIGVIIAGVAFVKRLVFGRRPRTRGAAVTSGTSNSLATERISNV